METSILAHLTPVQVWLLWWNGQRREWYPKVVGFPYKRLVCFSLCGIFHSRRLTTTCSICFNYMYRYGVSAGIWYGVSAAPRCGQYGVSAGRKALFINAGMVFQRVLWCRYGVSAWKTWIIHRAFHNALAIQCLGRDGGLARAHFQSPGDGAHI